MFNLKIDNNVRDFPLFIETRKKEGISTCGNSNLEIPKEVNKILEIRQKVENIPGG